MPVKRLNLTTSMIEGILFGFIVAILLYFSPTPPGFAIAGGIIFGIVAFFVLDDRKKEQ
jgi:xanthosine utilization system XapX-like protein